MKVMIFGITGMLGHKMFQVFKNSKHEIIGVMRKKFKEIEQYKFFEKKMIIEDLDVSDFAKVENVISEQKPDVVINCVGIIKPLTKGEGASVRAISINSLFPHKLSDFCKMNNSRLIHISTDCVFSGEEGNYNEESITDARDLYGLSKFLGEITNEENALTIRTSIIGRELGTQYNLIEWILSQKGKEVNGFANALFTGVTTKILSDIVMQILDKPELYGLIHVGGEIVNKYDLLHFVNDSYDLGMTISKFTDFKCDRSFDSSKFKTLGIEVPSMKSMIKELSEEEY